MAIIKPFRGVLYNKELVKDIADVAAPPYDVLLHYVEVHRHSLVSTAQHLLHLLLGDGRVDAHYVQRSIHSARLDIAPLVYPGWICGDNVAFVVAYRHGKRYYVHYILKQPLPLAQFSIVLQQLLGFFVTVLVRGRTGGRT